MTNLKNYKVNHELSNKYKLFVRIKGEKDIHDVCNSYEEFMEFRCRIVMDKLTDKFEFFFDFNSKNGQPIDEHSVITIEEDGTLSDWPYVPNDDTNAKLLGFTYECWNAPFQYLMVLTQQKVN